MNPTDLSSINAQSVGRNRSRRTRVAGILAAIVVFAGIAFYAHSRDGIRRFYRFAIYANAMEYYGAEYGALPPTIDQLHEAYNAYDGKRWTIPVEPNLPPPIYRPYAGDDGQYLLLIEPEPKHWFPTRRWVIFGRLDDWTMSVESVWNYEVDRLVAADDANRPVPSAP